MKRPINIAYEVAFYMIATLGVWSAIISIFNISGPKAHQIFMYQIIVYYFVLIFVIALRIFLKKQIDRLPISMFIFGFCSGYYYWGLFGWSEVHSNIKNIWDWLLFLLLATPGGVVGGLVAIPVGYTFFGVLALIELVVKRVKGNKIQ